MPKYAYERVNANEPMPGVIAVHLDAPIGEVIQDLLLIVEASDADDFENQVVYLPLE